MDSAGDTAPFLSDRIDGGMADCAREFLDTGGLTDLLWGAAVEALAGGGILDIS